jgi:uncharacterized protein YxjI
VFRVRDTVYIKDADGTELVKLQKRLVRARDTMAIERGDERVATIKKGHHRPATARFTIDLAGRGSLQAQANILNHEYQITRDGIPVANISKRWFRVRESYGVAAPGGRRRSWLAAQSSTSAVPGRPKSTLYSCRAAGCSCILVPAVPARRARSHHLLCN